MIEPTDEMAEVGWDALPVSAQQSGEIDLDDMKAVLTAVFALVERDHQPPPVTVVEVIDSLPKTDVQCRVWLRDHRLGNGAGIATVMSAIRRDLRKIAGGEGRG